MGAQQFRRGSRRLHVPLLTKSILPFVFCGFLSNLCLGQAHSVLCSDGNGKFEAKFETGVTAIVGAAKKGKLATRACEATLRWDKQDLAVVPEAYEVDLDAFGVDLGLGTPVAAFQVEKSDAHSFMAYEIYSLQKPPQLLRTITGGDFFSAADTDMDGRVEIWTGDAGAVDGFEGLSVGELDFVPTVVLRFERNQLIDVSAEFQSHFDNQIAQIRSRLNSQELINFKHSDGRLPATSPMPMEEQHQLRLTKIKVLEIVWSYLYSGREREAWLALAQMWPPADLERIRASIVTARASGIRAQVNGVSPGGSAFRFKKHEYVYDTVSNPDGALGSFALVETRPKAILLRRPPPLAIQQALPNSEVLIDLVIDSAGKVRSAKGVGETDKDLISATAEWKFIPAFKNGRAVASRLQMAVFPYR